MKARGKPKSHRRLNGPVIAIDGPAGAGKSTIAKRVATRLKLLYIDTGAMYRALTWKALQEGISSRDARALVRLARRIKLTLRPAPDGCRVFVDGKEVTHKFRTERVSRETSTVSAVPGVRRMMRRLQRRLGQKGGVVMEGRDIGTAVFPDADIKFYLDASPEERARRRYKELAAKGERVSLSAITKAIRRRDRRDQSRGTNPLKKAPDAIVVDSTHLDLEGAVDVVLRHVRK